MDAMPDVTESLLSRTKKLLDQRGELTLRQVAEGAGVGLEWVRGLTYGAIKDPGISRLEKLHGFLVEYHAAKRFEHRGEARAP